MARALSSPAPAAASARVPRVPRSDDTEADIQDHENAEGESPSASRSADSENGSNTGDETSPKRRRGRRGGRRRSSKKTEAEAVRETPSDDFGADLDAPAPETKPEKSTRSRRGGRRRRAAPESDAPEAPEETEAAPRKRSRRTRRKPAEPASDPTSSEESPPKRTRRRRGKAAAEPSEATPETPADAEAPRKRSRRRRRSEDTPSEAPERQAPERQAAEPRDEGETRRRRRRRSGGTRAAADAERDSAPRRGRTAARDEPDRKPSRSGRARDEAPRRSPRQPAGRSRSIDEFFDVERLYACQRAINYHFRDLTMLENALTHSSVKSDDRPSYERLEFLGDSVVGLVVANYLYDLKPDFDEGELTKVKSDVVSTDGLADAAKACGLDQFLAVGRGIQMRDGPPKSLIADVFEAVVGAVYLDRGYEAVRLYVLDHLNPFIEEALSEGSPKNFKSVLQQVAQREFGETPRYEVVRRSGPDHSRTYEVLAVLGSRRYKSARGATKKEAEQAAAKRALQAILREKSKSRRGGSSRSGGRRRRRSRGSSSSA